MSRNELAVLICPRDGAKVIELKDTSPGDAVVTGYWCEEGHKLGVDEKPREADG